MRKSFFYLFIFLMGTSIHLFGEESSTSIAPGISVSEQQAFALEKASKFYSNDDSYLDGLAYVECEIIPVPDSSQLSKRCTKGIPIPMNAANQNTHNTSYNWSGYVSATSLAAPAPGSVTIASGLWWVPTLSPSAGNAYSSIWAGIDGYANGTVEQIGTEHSWVNGAQQNYGWFEMYPGPAYYIVGFTMAPGDLIGGRVEFIGNGVFQMTIINYTRNIYTNIPTAYTTSSTAQRSSAEWIVEAPSSTQGILPLANFGRVFLNSCLARINGVTAAVRSNFWQHTPIFMVTADGTAFKAAPSNLSPDGDDFNVTWYREQ
jgi:hypothetical protein